MSYRTAAAICIAAAIGACRPATTPPALPFLPDPPAARLAALRAREDAVRTLRVRFDCAVDTAGGGRRSAAGVLLVAKPDRFRLRLVLPFGLTAFDYLRSGERSWITLPLAASEQPTAAPFSGADIGEAFLRGPAAFPGQCEARAAAGDRVWVSCSDRGALRRAMLIGRDGIIEETAYEDDVPVLRIRYADYRAAEGTALPFRIAVDDLRNARTVDIAVERYEVNIPLADQLFAPAPGGEPPLPAGAGKGDGMRSGAEGIYGPS